MRFSAVPLAALVLAIACDQTSPDPVAPVETTPAFQKHQITRIDETSGTFELRLENCLGELIIVTGTVRYKEHTLTDPATGNNDHQKVTFYLSGRAVGQTTGRVWTYKEVSQLKFNTPNLQAPHGNFASSVTARLVSRGSQPNAKIRVKLHVVINGKGVQKVVFDTVAGECRF
jgi:hypothetical protein